MKENQPAGASNRCLSCQVKSTRSWFTCKIYLGEDHKCIPHFRRMLTANLSEENARQALRDGPYDHCAYRCDNDVMDRQVVNLRFAHQQAVTFTMTVFTKIEDRKTRLFGTRGCPEGDDEQIWAFDFLVDKETVYQIKEIAADTQTQMGGHGGGDYYLMDRFIHAVMVND